MKKSEEPSSFYYEAINLIDLDDYDGAINSIKKNIDSLENPDDIALAYLNCGFLNDKLGENISAIDDFSKSIFFESKIDIIKQRSKDISFSGRSNSRYKAGDYQGAIDDKRKAKKIRLLEIDKSNELDNTKIDYKNIKLLKRYVSENGKILPSRITSISQKKQRELSASIKRARNLALI